MLRGAREIADFILDNYDGKVIEVGIGFAPEVALMVRQHREVLGIDNEMRCIEGLSGLSLDLSGLSLKIDDIFDPRKELYVGASLLYSIRPPIEIQIAMGRLAADIGADVLIRPLGDEIADLLGFSRRLVNIGEARFYHFKLKS